MTTNELQTKKQFLTKLLDTNKCIQVEFKTKVGTIRTMKCTRLLSEIPEKEQLGISLAKLNGPDIIAIFDFLVNEWRAFRVDSVIKFEVIEG